MIMLDFMNLKKNDITCSLCNEAVRNDNCSPKGCTHVFHSSCFENWTVNYGSSEEFTCPAPGCTSKFFEIVVRKIPHGLATKVVSLKESHQCPICCEPVQTPVAMPESCNHTFCYVCLREWSRVRHECPLDRGTFELILLSETIGGPITKRVAPPPVQPMPEDPPEVLDTQCEVCALPDDEEHLLLCDHCDRGYHTYCLPTPLSSIPPGDWFCPDCVRHGIGVNASPVTTRSARSRSHRQRRTRTTVADREAVESDFDEGMSSSFDDEDSGDETFHISGELSSSSQQRLTRLATRRHRGARLLQDTISRLAARILSEASDREQRRNRTHRRARQRTTTDVTSTTARNRTAQHGSSSQTVLVRNAEPGQPTTLGISRNVASGPSRNRRPNDSAASSDETLSAARRRRLFVLSDSSSDEEENGIAPNIPRPTDVQRRRRPRPLLESDGNNLAPGSMDASSTADLSRPAKRTRLLSTTTNSEPSVLEGSSTLIGTNQVSEQHGASDSGSEDANSAPVAQPRSSSSTTSRARATVAIKRKTKKKKRKRLSMKLHSRNSRVTKSGRRKKVTRSRRTARLTLTQKKIKKKAVLSSISASTSTRKPSGHRSPLKASTSVLPKLSILGAEPGYSLYTESSSLDEFSSPTSQAAVTEPQPSTSNSGFRPAAPSLLREIENGQASLFKFSTKHMYVNPDHSMSPIAVTKSTRTSQPASSTAPSTSLFGPASTVPSTRSSASVPTTSSYFSKSELSSSSGTVSRQQNNKVSAPTTTASVNQNSKTVSASSTTTTKTICPLLSGSDRAKGWSVERLAHAETVLKAALKPHITAGRIDKTTYLQILDRALTKIKQKDCVKVTDARISKLAAEYVDYMQRHGAT